MSPCLRQTHRASNVCCTRRPSFFELNTIVVMILERVHYDRFARADFVDGVRETARCFVAFCIDGAERGADRATVTAAP